MKDCKNKKHEQPCKEEKPAAMIMEDVWGKYDDHHNRVTPGMIAAKTGMRCPIFKDKVPSKSVTVVGPIERETEIIYWLEHVHGANCVVRTKELPNDKIAIRSDYQCW